MYIKDINKNKYYLEYEPKLTGWDLKDFYAKRNGCLRQYVNIYVNDKLVDDFTRIDELNCNENTVFRAKFLYLKPEWYHVRC